MSRYVNPFPQHFELNGNPLAAYTVYFGEPNQDPIANPKAIYFDKIFDNPLSPVQTLNSAGAYEQDIFLDGLYSIRIEAPLGFLWREASSFTGVTTLLLVTGVTLASMILDGSLSVGDFVSALGREIPGDGGDNVYEIVAAATGTNDGGSFIDLSGSGHQAKGLFPGGLHNIKQWGAKGDGVTDETTSVQAAINAAATNFSLYIPIGTHSITSLTIPAGLSMIGEDRELSKFENVNNTNLFVSSGNADIHIENIAFRYNGGSTTFYHLRFTLCDNVSIKNCFFDSADNEFGRAIGIIDGCTNVTIKDNVFERCAFALAGITSSAINKNVLVEGNYIADCVDDYVDLNNGCEDWRILGNHFVETTGVITTPLDQGEMVDIGGNIAIKGILVSNNTFELNGVFNTAIRIKGVSTDVVVSNNTIRNGQLNADNNSHGAIYFACLGRCVASGNIIEGVLRGITFGRQSSITVMRDMVVSNNVLKNIADIGIQFEKGAGAKTMINFVISNNVINTCGAEGIALLNATWVDISGNIFRDITGTIISDGGGGSNISVRGGILEGTLSASAININTDRWTVDGVQIQSTTRGIDIRGNDVGVTNCSIRNLSSEAIVYGAASGTVTGGVISGNNIFDTTGMGTTVGIRTGPLTTINDVVITGNSIRNMATALLQHPSQFARSYIGPGQGDTPIQLPSADSTPEVALGETFKTGGSTTITDFDSGHVGQTITILATSSITITDNAAIKLSGSGNYAMTATDTLTLHMFDDQIWQEVGRSVN